MNKQNLSLIEYITLCHSKYLNKRFSLEDCTQHTILFLLKEKSGRLIANVQENTVPNDPALLRLLKSIIIHSKLNFVRQESRHLGYKQKPLKYHWHKTNL